MKLLERYAPIYQTLEGQEEIDPTLMWLGRKLADWQVTTVYPVALQIGSEDVSAYTREQLSQLIYSYIVRRALCGLTTKNLNKVFQSIASEFVKNGVSVSGFKKFFAEKAGDSSKFPTDRELRTGIIAGKAYAIAPKSRLVDILWELELCSKTKLSEKTDQPDGLWIEHVMPQTWTDEWPFEDGSTGVPENDDAKSVARNALLHSLGNLSLMTGGLNISSGNKSFAKKRKKFKEHSCLFLNKWLINKKTWTEAEIRERGEHLADLAVTRWIGLERIE